MKAIKKLINFIRPNNGEWLYELGHKHGWDQAVIEMRKGYHLITTAESEARKIKDQTFDELLAGKVTNAEK